MDLDLQIKTSWIMDLMDFKSRKSIIHGFEMDLDLQIKTSWIMDLMDFKSKSMDYG